MWLVAFLALLVLLTIALASIFGGDTSISGAFDTLGDIAAPPRPAWPRYLPIVPVLFFANFLILFGPMLMLGIQQIKAYEPGDADWGVRLGDVRGQIEAKQEITRVVSLWQSGEEFVKAGGKRERGVLFLGAPGTGKTMLSKAIATSFNCPFVTIPGSGIRAELHRHGRGAGALAGLEGTRLAAKWGGQCIVFIDEIDAVGRRRSALGSGFTPEAAPSVHDHFFFGRNGALTREGDLVLETAEWRERCSPPAPSRRARTTRRSTRARTTRSGNVIPMMGGGQGGGLALNQLLVVMDGIDEPPRHAQVLHAQVQHVPGRAVLRPAALWRLRLRLQAAEAAAGADLLHRGLQRGARGARPGAHAAGPDGPPHLLPHAHVGGPARHLRPLPRQGRARRGARHAAQARRAGPHHQRLLAGDDRPGLLARAHLRARGRARGLPPDGPRRGDDDGRGGRRDRPAIPEARGAGDGDPRGRARRLRPRVHGEPAVDAAVDPQARVVGRAPPGDGDRGPVRPLALGGGRRPDLEPRRNGRRARLLRPEHDRRDRRRRLGHRPRGDDGRVPRHGPGADRRRPTGSRTRRNGGDRERHPRAVRADRLPDHEPVARAAWTRTRSGRRSRTAPSARWSPACSARRSSSPTRPCCRTARAPSAWRTS